MWKPQFLKNLIDSTYMEDYDDVFEDEYDTETDSTISEHISLKEADQEHAKPIKTDVTNTFNGDKPDQVEPNADTFDVDVYQTPEEIVVKTMVAGIPPNNIDISLTRDMLTITGEREEKKEVTEDNYFYKELVWGSFTRTIMLPAEVEVDEADAKERHGILTIRLPKINKERQAKIKVKSD